MNAQLCSAIALGATLVSCLSGEAERARLDEAVGHASAGGVEFEVVGGLAAVVEVAPGRLTLRASAPEITILTAAGATPTQSWIVEVRNAMPAAQLSRRRDTLPAERFPRTNGPIPTVARWTLDVAANEVSSLTVGPDDVDVIEPFRFAVINDVQTGIDRVGDLIAAVREEPGVRFQLTVGDLTEAGTRPQLRAFQKAFEPLGVPVFSTVGNHEVFSSPEHYHALFGRVNLSFRFKGTQFTLVDSASASLDGAVYEQLDEWLSDGAVSPHLFATHIPPVDPVGLRNSAFRSRREANALLERLAAAAVDFTIYGHLHSFYRFSNAGIPAVVSGGGGASPERLDGIGRHYLLVEVDPSAGDTMTVHEREID